MKNLWGDKSLDDILQNDNLTDKKLMEINEDLIKKKIDISDLVEALGPALTSPNTDLRSYSTKFLSNTLTNVPDDFLTVAQLNLISSFYGDRIKDHHSVVPNVILGILSISKMKNLEPGNSTMLLNSIFMNIPCQTQLRDDRSHIYEIIREMVARHSDELKKIGPDFVYGVISAIEGERDPRNLMFLFTYMPKFMKIFELGHLAEEMFETFECYFPIDFHPTQNDPATITREKLAQELAVCLCGSPDFVEKCVDLALEKLDSDLIVAKLDSIDLLSRGTRSFDIVRLEQQFQKIWSALRTEVLPGTTKEITDAALNALVSFLDAAAINNQTTENILKIVFDSIFMQLSDTKNRLFQPSIGIVFKLLRSRNDFSTVWMTNRVVPILLAQINEHEDDKVVISIDERCRLLEFIDHIVSSALSRQLDSQLDQALVDNVQNHLLQNLESENVNLVQKSFDCLKNISKIINAKNRTTVYTKFNNILRIEQMRVDVNKCIQQFAIVYPEEVYDKIVKELIATDLEKTIINKENVWKIYEILCNLITIPYFIEHAINFIFSEIFVKKNTKMLEIFDRTISTSLFDNQIKLILYRDHHIIDRLVDLVRSTDNNPPLDSNTLVIVKNVTSVIVRALPADDQNVILKKYLGQLNLKSGGGDFYVAAGILSHVSNQSTDDLDLESVLNELTDIALSTGDSQIREMTHHLLCSLVNKLSNTNTKHQGVLKKMVIYLKDEIKKQNEKAVEVLSWISKGLLIQGHSDAAEIIEDLAHLLEHPTLSSVAVLAFEIISVEFPELHLPIVKLLFKQKLFQIVLHKIIDRVETLSEKHLTALSFVLKITPHTVLKSNLNKVGPILFKCLEINSVKSIQISLEIICRFVEETDDYFKDHLQYLIPQFIKLSQFKDSLKIRIAALNSLKDVTKYPVIILLPFKHDVIYGLIPALDDHKRLVRNAAVDARTIWFLIGSVGE